MKALGRKTLEQKVRHEADRYVRDEYNKLAYEAIAGQMPEIMRQTAATFLWAMSQHGYGAKRLRDCFDWFEAVCNMPPVFDQTMKMTDIKALMQAKYGIDFSKINPHLESYEEFCDGSKE